MKTSIVSHGTFLPSTIINSNELFSAIDVDRRYGIANDWMSSTMGIVEKRVADPGTKPSKLAIESAERALARAPHVRPDDIGMVLFCGIERDQTEPATAHKVQHALGLNAEHVFDISNACYGFIDGLKVASNFVAAGLVKYALVTTGEVQANQANRFIEKLESDVDPKEASKIIGFLSAGDAGGAVIVGPSENADSGFELFNGSVDSSHNDKCFYRITDDGIEGQMLMARIVAHGFKMQKRILQDTLAKLGWSEFDWFLSHQTGKRNFEQIASLGIIKEERMIKTYPTLGNITSATFPVSYEKLLEAGSLKKGDHVGGAFGGSGLVVGQFGYTY